MGRLLFIIFASFNAFILTSVTAQTRPDKDYLVYVLSESADRIALVRFGPGGARVGHDLHTGEMPTDINGPQSIAIARDKKFYYVSLAHGRPFGTVWKYAVDGDRVLGQTRLGLFPATIDISKDGDLLFIVNFNLHGDMAPSSVSVVELARLPTKRRVLHGVVVSPDDAYAFVTVEGVGAEPGTVEIIDLAAMKTVATLDVGQQASGIDFLKVEPAP